MKNTHAIIAACEKILEGTGQLPQAITVDISTMQSIRREIITGNATGYFDIVHTEGKPRLFMFGRSVEIIEGKPRYSMSLADAMLYHPTR